MARVHGHSASPTSEPSVAPGPVSTHTVPGTPDMIHTFPLLCGTIWYTWLAAPLPTGVLQAASWSHQYAWVPSLPGSGGTPRPPRQCVGKMLAARDCVVQPPSGRSCLERGEQRVRQPAGQVGRLALFERRQERLLEAGAEQQ